MDAIEFVINYEKYLGEIEQVVKPEYLPAIERLRANDPHDLESLSIRKPRFRSFDDKRGIRIKNVFGRSRVWTHPKP